MSGGQVGQEGPGLTKDTPETSAGPAAAAGQVGWNRELDQKHSRVIYSSLLTLEVQLVSDYGVEYGASLKRQQLMKCLHDCLHVCTNGQFGQYVACCTK